MMGLSPFSSGATTSSRINPKNFKVIQTYSNRGYLLAWLQYPQCFNYKGYKIILFKELFEVPDSVDPHFLVGNETILARFRPTSEMWSFAVKFIDTLPVIDLTERNKTLQAIKDLRAKFAVDGILMLYVGGKIWKHLSHLPVEFGTRGYSGFCIRLDATLADDKLKVHLTKEDYDAQKSLHI